MQDKNKTMDSILEMLSHFTNKDSREILNEVIKVKSIKL